MTPPRRFTPRPAHGGEECLSGAGKLWGLPLVVIFGFVRIATNPRAFQNPMTPKEAAGHVRAWLARPGVQILESGPLEVERVLKLLESVGTAGNLVTDAQIAVAALEHDAVLHTSDSDFIRFPGLRWFNPITGAGSRLSVKSRDPKAFFFLFACFVWFAVNWR